MIKQIKILGGLLLIFIFILILFCIYMPKNNDNFNILYNLYQSNHIQHV